MTTENDERSKRIEEIKYQLAWLKRNPDSLPEKEKILLLNEAKKYGIKHDNC